MRGNTGEVAWEIGRQFSNCVFCLIDFEIPRNIHACATWAFGNLSLLLRGRTKLDATET